MFNSKNKKWLCKCNVSPERCRTTPKKLDYFLVSNRWRSCVVNTKTDWEPSAHRFGKEFDHILLWITWSWRTRKEKMTVSKDFKAMTKKNWAELNDMIAVNLKKHDEKKPTGMRHAEVKVTINERLNRMNNCIQDVTQSCVPTKKRLSTIKREVSDRTHSLYKARTQKFGTITAQGGTSTKHLRKRWNRRIRDANLADYNTWLEAW